MYFCVWVCLCERKVGVSSRVQSYNGFCTIMLNKQSLSLSLSKMYQCVCIYTEDRILLWTIKKSGSITTSVLQSVAVCVKVCFAVCCSLLQYVAVCCSMLQCVQCVAVCVVGRCSARCIMCCTVFQQMQCLAVCCSVYTPQIRPSFVQLTYATQIAGVRL